MLWLTDVRLSGTRAPGELGRVINQTTSSSDSAHVVIEIATASADATTATTLERIKILPTSNSMSRDGRSYIFHVKAFNADGVDIRVDLEYDISKTDEPDRLCVRFNWVGAVKDIL